MEDMLDYRAMGKRVRERRLALRLTQERLAECVDVSASFIGHIERGEKKASLETIARLSRELKSPMDYLALGVRPQCERYKCPLYVDFVELMHAYGLDGGKR